MPASLPQNMRQGVRYFVTLKKGMLIGLYEGKNYDGRYMFQLTEPRKSAGQIVLVPHENIVGVAAAKS